MTGDDGGDHQEADGVDRPGADGAGRSMLVTGGTGFLGLHVCNRFAAAGWDVTALDREPFDETDDVGDVDYLEGDIRDEACVERVMDGVDVVVHAAAALALWDDDRIHSVTVDGTRTVLSAATDAGVDRVVFVSSITVYGDDASSPITEDAPLSAIGAYGQSKIDAERVCEAFRDDLTVTILRPPSFVGPYRLGIFEILFDWIDDGASVPLIGRGDNRYQLLHVSDLVDAIELLIDADPEVANDTYNVGADEFRTMRHDFQAPIDYAGTGKRTVGTPVGPTVWVLRILERLNLSPLYPWVYETAHRDHYLSVEKLKQVGWEPQYSNRAALVETYRWYLENVADTAEARGDTAGELGHRVGWDQGAIGLVKPLFKLL
jgi:nucleoside-diphosphate-sugar epimerase